MNIGRIIDAINRMLGRVETYTINVTEEHISQGTRNAPAYCPIALAIEDVFEDPTTYADVGEEEIGVFDYPDLLVGVPNTVVQAFIRAYDAGEAVKPFTFRLELN